MEKIRNLWALLRGELWILPTAMSGAALALAFALIRAPFPDFLASERLWWLYAGNLESARGLLASFLSGLMTMTSLVVSMTFVILSLAANQLGPRLIWNFISDRQIQAVLGLFIATIFYVIMVLRSLGDDGGSVPHIAVSVASLMTILCVMALLFYVHKIAKAIIVDNVIARISDQLMAAVTKRHLRKSGKGPPPPPPRREAQSYLCLQKCGYVQSISYEALLRLAVEMNGAFIVTTCPGEHLLERDMALGWVGPTLPEKCFEKARAAFVVGSQRSPAQDIGFPIQQLVEVALRALSPGINDPFSAIAVIHRLGVAYEQLLVRQAEPDVMYDEKSVARVFVKRSSVADLLSAGFDPIRRAAGGHFIVLDEMIDILEDLAEISDVDERQSMTDLLEKLEESCLCADFSESDRRTLQHKIAVMRHH